MNKLIKNDFSYAVLISISIIIICLSFEKSFFFVDDAQNEFLPFIREIGKGWLNGEIPFILKDTFIGSNTMIDIHRAIFLPQNILLSVLSVYIKSLKLLSVIYAFINLFIMSFSSLKTSQGLSLSKSAGIVISILFCINPIFLYFYMESWWNAASGQAFFVASLASVLWLFKGFNLKRLVLNIISVLCILASGWPHSVLVYGVLSLVFIYFLYLDKRYKDIWYFLLISLSIILIAIPLYSEYIISGDLINRESFKFNNAGNFLSTTLNQIIFTFNASYFHFMHRYGGYNITHISFGYSSIYILIFLIFGSVKEIFNKKETKFLFILTVLFFILTQTPVDLGPTRYPFRFTPYFSEVLILFSVVSLEKFGVKKSKNRIIALVIILVISLLLSIFALDGEHYKFIILQIIFFVLTLIYIVKYKIISFVSGVLYTVSMLFIMLFAKSSIIGYLSFPDLKNELNMENNYSKGGYLLSLTNGRYPKDHVEDLNSTHFMLYGIKAINGASPVGNKYISQLISTWSSQNFFDGEKTIEKLSKKYNEACYFDLLNIDTIVINSNEIKPKMLDDLYKCNFKKVIVRNPNVVFFIKDNFLFKGNISYISDGVVVNGVKSQNYNSEVYDITGKKGDEIIFSRVFWYGYKGYIDGIEYKVNNQNGLLKITLDRDISNGHLEIKYFPSSWKYSLWFSLFGILLSIVVLNIVRKKKF